jgi:hypothetical protein
MKYIIYSMPDSSVRVGYPCEAAKKNNETDDEFLNRIMNNDRPVGCIGACIQESIPTVFRDAWRTNNCEVYVDMEVARTIKMKSLEEKRVSILAETQALWFSNLEAGTPDATLNAHRNAVRNLLIDLGSIQTPEDLYNYEPNWPVL